METAKIKQALSIVKPALANKEIIEQTTSFAFIKGNVITYNDEICISHKLDDLEFEGVIKAEELYKFLGKVKQSEFTIDITDAEIQLKAGRARVGFALNKEILLPLDEELHEKSDWKKLPDAFLQACKFAAASASSDMSDAKLTCVHFNEKGIIEATNNFRLVRWKLSERLPFNTTLIPASSIKEVVRIKPIEVSMGNGWVHFRNLETTISCRILDEKFVNIQQILKGIKDTEKVVFPDGLLQIIEKAEIFRQEQKTDGSITLNVKNGRITVKSESETARFKETIAYNEEHNLSFSITPYLLKDILKETNECNINNQVLLFKNANWVYLTSLRTYNHE